MKRVKEINNNTSEDMGIKNLQQHSSKFVKILETIEKYENISFTYSNASERNGGKILQYAVRPIKDSESVNTL